MFMFSDGNTFKIGPKSLLREKGFSIQPNGVKIISELCCFPSFFSRWWRWPIFKGYLILSFYEERPKNGTKYGTPLGML